MIKLLKIKKKTVLIRDKFSLKKTIEFLIISSKINIKNMETNRMINLWSLKINKNKQKVKQVSKL